ncbi:MAG: hypothetical protein HQL95_07310 [Magnetococcales bacterium]|nr:hypothetical protein [Magnetococcales bacterium]
MEALQPGVLDAEQGQHFGNFVGNPLLSFLAHYHLVTNETMQLQTNECQSRLHPPSRHPTGHLVETPDA